MYAIIDYRSRFDDEKQERQTLKTQLPLVSDELKQADQVARITMNTLTIGTKFKVDFRDHRKRNFIVTKIDEDGDIIAHDEREAKYQTTDMTKFCFPQKALEDYESRGELIIIGEKL